MMTRANGNSYSPEVGERAVRMVIERRGEYAHRLVGWRVNRTAHADSFWKPLSRRTMTGARFMTASLFITVIAAAITSRLNTTERLAEVGIEMSVGSVGDSYNNALAETINGLYNADLIHRRGPWRSFEAVELATLAWADLFNHRRLLQPVGYIPPAKAEARYDPMLDEPAMAA